MFPFDMLVNVGELLGGLDISLSCMVCGQINVDILTSDIWYLLLVVCWEHQLEPIHSLYSQTKLYIVGEIYRIGLQQFIEEDNNETYCV